MSPSPVTAVAAWTLALVVDVVAVALAAIALVWNHTCPQGVALCPAPADLARQDAWVLVALAAVLLAVALYGLLRGRWLLLVVQLALGAVLVLAAQAWVPNGFEQLRHDVHLAGGAPRS